MRPAFRFDVKFPKTAHRASNEPQTRPNDRQTMLIHQGLTRFRLLILSLYPNIPKIQNATRLALWINDEGAIHP